MGFRVPVLKSLYEFILSITQGPTIWVPGLLGVGKVCCTCFTTMVTAEMLLEHGVICHICLRVLSRKYGDIPYRGI